MAATGAASDAQPAMFLAAARVAVALPSPRRGRPQSHRPQRDEGAVPYPDDNIRMMAEQMLEHAQPLTLLAEDEAIFRDSVREFADAQIRPLVREMDEHARIPRELVEKLFDLGVMGIEIPDAYGGAGASFFHAVLAVEELSRVDPSIGVLVDVQN